MSPRRGEEGVEEKMEGEGEREREGRRGGLVPDFLAPFHVGNTGGPGQPQVSDRSAL